MLPVSGLYAAETASTGAATTPTPDYHPSMGDLMTMAVQPRHTKLGLAGEAGNWAYATYELSELRNAFARIARTIPTYNNVDTASTFTAMVQAPLDALATAIQSGQVEQFRSAYRTLTATCNACHVSLNHAPVVIQEPKASSYPDQDFRPAKH